MAKKSRQVSHTRRKSWLHFKRYLHKCSKFKALQLVLKIPLDPVWYYFCIISVIVSLNTNLYIVSSTSCETFPEQLNKILECLDFLYMLDVVFFFFIKVFRIEKPLICLADRPYIVLVVEAITLLPYWGLMPSHLPKAKEKYYCLVGLKYCLRVIRPIYFLNLYNRQLSTNPLVTCLVLVFGVTVLGLPNIALYCNIHSSTSSICNSSAYVVTMGLSHIALLPFGEPPLNCIYWNLGGTIVITLMFIILILPTVIQLTFHVIRSCTLRYFYVLIYRSYRLTHAIYNVPEYLQDQTTKYFNKIWKNCGGYSEDLSFFEKACHPALTKEIKFDVSWPAFEHSQLFRHLDMYSLLQMSSIIKRQFLVAGDYVYKRGEIKQKMVYVASGTIVLLSEVDAESPIISLTNGTCLGEVSLLISYKSQNTVKCKTFCELLVIERKDFLEMMKKLPNRAKYLRIIIESRIDYAKRLKHIFDNARNNVNNNYRDRDTYTVHWLKHTLHNLMSVDEDSTRKHELQNIYLLHKIDETVFDPLIFTAEYLDMLSIAERYETEKDTLFIKSTFPYVFQPNSVIVVTCKYLVAAITVFAGVWIPYKAFLDTTPGSRADFLPSYLITLCFCLDVYLQLSVAIPSRNGMITKTGAIFLRKLRLVGFWADVVASIPLEIFTSVIIRNLNDQYSAMLCLNRLMKLFKLAIMFRDWETKFDANVIFVRYIKYVVLHLYLIYFVYCLMRYLFPDLDWGLLLFTTGMVSLLSKNKDTHFLDSNINIFIIVNVIFVILYIAKFVYIISAIIMANISRLYAQQYCREVFNKIEARDLPKIYKMRTGEYLRLQYEENLGVKLRTDFYYLSKMPKTLHDNIMDAITLELWNNFPLFGDFLKEIMGDIYSIMSLETLPANEIIVYSGDYFLKCYVKYIGSIEIVDQFGNILNQEDETTSRVINVVTCLLNVPSVFTMRTVTVTRFIVFRAKDLLLALNKHPKYNEVLQATVAESDDIAQRLLEIASVETNVVVPPDKLPPKKNFHTFSYNLARGTSEEYDYHAPFDKLYPFGFLRVFLLRNTIYPDSVFLIIWESFRSFFAILSAILYVMPSIRSLPCTVILICLDVFAFVDIYVRMHVCYYGTNGILITHPLSITKHYFSHGFLLDLIGAFPVGLIITPYDSISYFMTYSNKLLQVHRYIGFMYILQIKSLTAVPPIFMISYLPVLLVIGNYFGSFIIHSECDSGVDMSKDLPDYITCYNDSIIETSNFHKPVTPLMGQAIALYVGISFITTAGWQNFLILRESTRLRVFILGFIGQILLLTCVGYVITYFIYRYGLLIDYQQSMKQLLAFMKLLKVPKDVRKYTITCCEEKWTLLNGKSFQSIIRRLHEPIQADILYEYYGVRAYNTSVFNNKSIPFYRNLIALSVYDIVVKYGYLVTLNDIEETLAIILRGNVDVVAADGTVLDTLYPGAIIGNLENKDWYRSKVSVIANCHVEIFSVKSKMFHFILSRFPKIRTEFETLKIKYLYYIPSRIQVINPDEVEYYAPKRKLIFTKSFHPDSLCIKIWFTIQLIVPCYIGILLDFFQMSTGNHNLWITICQYCCDVLFTTHFVFRNRIAYVNDYGVLVRDPQKIKERNAKNKFKYWINFCSIIPFEISTFLLPVSPSAMKTLYTILRMNRLLRLSYIFEFFAIMNKKLNINVYVIRFGFVLVWTSLALCGMSAIFGVFACNLSINMEPHIPFCSVLHEMEEVEMGKLHSRLLHLALQTITQTTQYVHSPQHPVLVFLFVIFMLVCHNLRAIITGQVFAAIFEVNRFIMIFRLIRKRLEFYCFSQDLDTAVMFRVSTYTDFLWFLYRGVQYPKMLTTLHPYIKDVLLASLCNKFFVNHIVFKDCHPDFLRQIMCKITFRMSIDSGYIQFKGNVENAMFFILQGEIDVMEDMFRDRKVHTLKTGESFGILQGIYEDNSYSYSYRCVGTTIVAVLKHEDWKHIIKFYPASKYIIYQRSNMYVGF